MLAEAISVDGLITNSIGILHVQGGPSVAQQKLMSGTPAVIEGRFRGQEMAKGETETDGGLLETGVEKSLVVQDHCRGELSTGQGIVS
jgi:hypothetical protein